MTKVESSAGEARPAPGLRERKKQQTRERIARVALELFDRDGFHETTIPAIAEAADVSPRTVSSYFPAKEDLVFPDVVEVFGALGTRLNSRAAGETTADALREWLREQLPDWEAHEERSRVQRRVVASDQGLQAHEQRFRAEAEQMIAKAIADDLGSSSDSLEARMAAAAMFAIFGVLGDDQELGDGDPCKVPGGLREPGTAPVDAMQLLDRALRFVDAGIRSLLDPEDLPRRSNGGRTAG